MDLFEVIENRRSVRAFLAKPVKTEELHHILEAANQAPSAGNLQAYRIHQVTDPATKQALAEAALGQDFLATAPVVLAFSTDPDRCRRYGERGRELYSVQDASIATAYAQLAAHALGLASCWVGAFDESEVAEVLRLGGEERPVALLPIGYAAEKPLAPPRRALGDLVTKFPVS